MKLRPEYLASAIAWFGPATRLSIAGSPFRAGTRPLAVACEPVGRIHGHRYWAFSYGKRGSRVSDDGRTPTALIEKSRAYARG